MSRLITLLTVLTLSASSLRAAMLRVPADHKSIRTAIEAAASGDVVLVAPGRYPERVRLKPGVTLRSDGDNTPAEEGLNRAKETILDGGGDGSKEPGVLMAEGSTLDGFTVTNVGLYDEKVWQKHFESHGEELGDEEGAVAAEGTVAAVSVRGVSCVIRHCIVHHNGDVGIGVLGKEKCPTVALISANVVYRNMGGGIGIAEGAEAIVRENVCRENLRAGIGCRAADPLILGNRCYGNVRAGIGCREKASPILRDNKCWENRRAGIGIRMGGTSPLVVGNECFENEMAGIGVRDDATPVLRNNTCRENKLAGIGVQQLARALITDNTCRANHTAGIGLHDNAQATIIGNICIDNQTTAIGVTGKSVATILNNTLSRAGGLPPLVAVKDGSTVDIRQNVMSGGGVAAVLVQGKAAVSGNNFVGIGEKQGTAVWAWEGSAVTVADNRFDRYKSAVAATKPASIAVTGNRLERFTGVGIYVKESKSPAHVHGNSGVSDDPKAKLVVVEGPAGVVAENELNKE